MIHSNTLQQQYEYLYTAAVVPIFWYSRITAVAEMILDNDVPHTAVLWSTAVHRSSGYLRMLLIIFMKLVLVLKLESVSRLLPGTRYLVFK